MKNAQEIIASTEEAVKSVEEKLQALQNLEAQAAELQAGLDQNKLDDADLLASDKSESQKIKALSAIRLSSEVKLANLSKLNTQIAEAKKAIIASAIDADTRYLGALRDGIAEARRARVLEHVSAFFVKEMRPEFKRLINFSLAVKEVDSLPRFTWVPARQDLCLDNAAKLRSYFDALAGLAGSEPEAEYVSRESWPVQANVNIEPASYIDSNQIGSLN